MILLLLAAATLFSSCSSSALDYQTVRDLTYTPKSWPTAQVADLYKPVSKRPAPAVLLIHGGGWSKSERRSDMNRIARNLARRGYFVMNATYRLTPEWQYPAPVEDLSEAIRYLRRNAGSLNIDPSRIATFGYSAGGHLAALTGLEPDNNISAIVAGGAPADLTLWPNGKLTGLLLGGPVKGNEAKYRAASPVKQVTRISPPVFLYHGTSDSVVPLEHPKAFIAALQQNDVPHEVYWIEGRSHIFTHLLSAEAIPKAINFLDKHLNHRAPAP